MSSDLRPGPSVVRAIALAAALAPALASTAHARALTESVDVGDEGFRCPGDDPGFWMDLEEQGWVGYGEAWDLHTCSEGADVYADGATSAWKDMRPRLANPYLKPMMTEAEIRYYTTVLPYMAFGSLAAVFVLAWAAAFIARFQKRKLVEVACGSCGTRTPLTAEEGGVFCPSCGTAVPFPGADGARA